MTDQVRQQVLDYLLGALDDSEMDAVAALLSSEPAYQQALPWARGEMLRLEVARPEVSPPPGLAQRTCRLVFNPAWRLRASWRPWRMTPLAATQHGRRHWSLADAGVAAAILLIAGLLVLPAISGSRFQARLITCQNNLRQVGQALTEYSDKNHDLFPVVPMEGNLAAAGIYAPILTQDGFLTEPETVLCPESIQAQERDFRVPSLAELRSAAGRKLTDIQRRMGGSYGYSLGYFDHGAYRPTRNLGRDYFAILADAPSNRPDHKSDNHGGLGQNVLFEDSHVEFCSTTRPGDGSDDIYTNNANVVAPGLNRDDAVVAPSGTGPVVFVSLP